MPHSPAPWKRGGEYSNNMDEIEDAEGRTIAAVWTRKGPQFAKASQQFREEPQGVANITLMVAAPDLLFASQMLADVSNHKIDALTHPQLINLIQDLRDSARAAVTKATGV